MGGSARASGCVVLAYCRRSHDVVRSPAGIPRSTSYRWITIGGPMSDHVSLEQKVVMLEAALEYSREIHDVLDGRLQELAKEANEMPFDCDMRAWQGLALRFAEVVVARWRADQSRLAAL